MNFKESIAYGVTAGLGAAALGYLIYRGGRWMISKKVPSNPYEAGKMVDEYMAFHYCPPDEYLVYPGGPRDGLEFPRRCAELCARHKEEGVLRRALDVGCAVGCSTFELCRAYEEVVGVDYSRGFIHKCQELKMTGQGSYQLAVEGSLVEKKTAIVHEKIDRTRVSFLVGDACSLPELGQFGCVLAANLICRLPDPMAFYRRLPDILTPGGVLVITSPYTWLQQYTPQSHWIGGYTDKDGMEVRGFDTLKKILGPHFDLLETVDMPFLIRETVRKHQWTVAHATVWRRKREEDSQTA